MRSVAQEASPVPDGPEAVQALAEHVSFATVAILAV